MLKTRRTVLVFLRLNSCWLLDQKLRWKLSLIRDFITTLIMPQYFCQIDQIPLHQVRYRRTVEYRAFAISPFSLPAQSHPVSLWTRKSTPPGSPPVTSDGPRGLTCCQAATPPSRPPWSAAAPADSPPQRLAPAPRWTAGNSPSFRSLGLSGRPNPHRAVAG